MVDNLQLEPLSVQFCGELMLEAPIDMCLIGHISIPQIAVNPPRIAAPVYVYVQKKKCWQIGLGGGAGLPRRGSFADSRLYLELGLTRYVTSYILHHPDLEVIPN